MHWLVEKDIIIVCAQVPKKGLESQYYCPPLFSKYILIHAASKETSAEIRKKHLKLI